jgi:ubiquinone/menaquinone biosynthesis C-methylase UbiE
VAQVLRPGGCFSFVEISVPSSRWLRWPYLFYINRVIPLIGRAFLGNPDNYRMLGTYTVAFRDCRRALAAFAGAGLVVQPASYFFGCATGVYGHKPG